LRSAACACVFSGLYALGAFFDGGRAADSAERSEDNVEVCRVCDFAQHLSGTRFGKIRSMHRHVMHLLELFGR